MSYMLPGVSLMMSRTTFPAARGGSMRLCNAERRLYHGRILSESYPQQYKRHKIHQMIFFTDKKKPTSVKIASGLWENSSTPAHWVSALNLRLGMVMLRILELQPFKNRKRCCMPDVNTSWRPEEMLSPLTYKQ